MHFGGIYEDEIVGKAYDRALMYRFVRYLRPYRWLVAIALFILPLTTAASVGPKRCSWSQGRARPTPVRQFP